MEATVSRRLTQIKEKRGQRSEKTDSDRRLVGRSGRDYLTTVDLIPGTYL